MSNKDIYIFTNNASGAIGCGLVTECTEEIYRRFSGPIWGNAVSLNDKLFSRAYEGRVNFNLGKDDEIIADLEKGNHSSSSGDFLFGEVYNVFKCLGLKSRDEISKLPEIHNFNNFSEAAISMYESGKDYILFRLF